MREYTTTDMSKLGDFICARCDFRTDGFWRMIDHAEKVHKLKVVELPIAEIYRKEGEI